jgi:hypothetical protein
MKDLAHQAETIRRLLANPPRPLKPEQRERYYQRAAELEYEAAAA